MPENDLPPLQYLLDCSENSLKSFIVAQLNRAANSRKHIRQIADDWIEARALALLGEWFELYGADLVNLVSSPREQPKLEVVTDHEKAALTPELKYEFWRSVKKHARGTR